MYKISQLQYSPDMEKYVERVYCFVGVSSPITNENYLESDLFTQKELQEIDDNETDVVIIYESIFIDDSIYVIKLKLANAIQLYVDTMDVPSVEEMYLFSQISKQFNATSMFEKYQQNGMLSLLHYFNIIRNIVDEELDFEQREYTYDDMVQLLNDKMRTMLFSIGQSSNTVYCVNPSFIDMAADVKIDIANNNSRLIIIHPYLVLNKKNLQSYAQKQNKYFHP